MGRTPLGSRTGEKIPRPRDLGNSRIVGYRPNVGWWRERVVRRARHAASVSGQTQAEYAVVVAALAVGAIVVVLFFGGALSGLWDRSGKPVTPATFNPPTNTTVLPTPKTKADCDDPGYASYGFADREHCITWVENNNP